MTEIGLDFCWAADEKLFNNSIISDSNHMEVVGLSGDEEIARD